MKFTVDLEKKTISIHGPFMVKEIDELLSLLNIDDKDTWLIEKYEQPVQWSPTYPYIPQQPIVNPYIGDGPVIRENPYTYMTTTSGEITVLNGNSNLTYTNGVLSGTTTNTWSVQNHDGKFV